MIDYRKYPLRVCRTLHECGPCGEKITYGQAYYDGGYGRRAHRACLAAPAEPRFELITSDASGENPETVDADLNLDEFCVDNDLDLKDCAAIHDLEIGGEYRMGGGAAPIATVRRVA